MSKQYYCEMDNSVFSTEEELIEHIKQNYVKVLENKTTSVSELLSELQKEFPDYEVHIKEGNGWYADYRIYLKKGNSEIEQDFGNKGNNHFKNPETIEEVLMDINEKINIVESIVKSATNRYHFKDFSFVDYTYGYSVDEHCYRFKFKLHGSNEIHEEYYYPYESEPEEFVAELERYFVKVLEGKPQMYREDGYFEDYTINGVRIEHMMNSKKVRLEVIEK